jgi:hypothetical protein
MAMRKIMDRLGAVWEREDLGVVLTEVDVPAVDTVPFSAELIEQIREATRKVIRAVSQ